MSKAVVGGAFLRIAQHAVGFGGFLELLFGRRIVGIAVGMKFLGEMAVRRLDILIAGILADTEHLVIISFRHGIHCATL